MTILTKPSYQALHGNIAVPRQPLRVRVRAWLIWLIVIALLAWSWGPAEMHKAANLITDWRNMADLVSGFMQPNLHNWRQYAGEMAESVQIALWATALAVIFGAPLSILASANVCPQWVVQPVRRMLDTFRAVHEMVWALIFVVSVGLGPIAGVLALMVHDTGIIGKLFSEQVESIDPRPVEGIRATGASRLQEVVFGVVPQVIPTWISLILYRLETNVRSATVLGIVGAGGIGQSLYENIRSFLYADTAMIILIIIGTVIFIDVLSSAVRKMVV
jgi:phosphonate transport system permease protein